MKILLIDTTTSHVNVSIIDNNSIVYSFNELIEDDMSSKIIPIIDTAFESLNFKIEDIDKILVANGPGSFTGIRIGVTIAKTIAWGLKKDIISVSSLELMATTKSSKKYLVPMMDARRGNVFAGIYDQDLNRVMKDQLINYNELVKKLNDDYQILSYDNIENSIEPDVDALKIVVKHKYDNSINPHNLNPNYLKLTEAEESRNNSDSRF